MRLIPTEAETQKAVLEILAAHNVFAGRLNTGAGFVNGRPVQHHTFGKGCADIIAFMDLPTWADCDGCEPLWIECKSPGKKQSPEQVTFQRHVESLGHTYLVVDSVDQVIAFLEEHHG